MQRRIVGIETEYGVTCTVDGHRRLHPDEIARYLFRPVVDAVRSSNAFLRNGSRLYLDVGSHPEYATAECDTLDDLFAADRAGDAILTDLAQRAETALDADHLGPNARVYLFRNNTDSAGNSYGCHENYMVERRDDFHKISRALLPFLVSRQLLVGSGKILLPGHRPPMSMMGSGAGPFEEITEPVFRLSQRAEHVWDGVSSATTRSRPVINTRDEPHADPENYRRMHVIVGDTSVLEPSLRLKVASTLLILELLEAGHPAARPLKHLSLDNDIRAIRTLSQDITGRTAVPLAVGGDITALGLQQTYCDAATAWLADREEDTNSEHLAAAVELWQRTLCAVETGDRSAIVGEIDWATKLDLFERYGTARGWGLDHPRIGALDLAYHDIRPGRGIGRVLEAKGTARRLTTDEAVAAATKTPPATTRARLRGEFVGAALDAGESFTVDWMHLKPQRLQGHTLILPDPLSAADERVDALIAELRAEATAEASTADPAGNPTGSAP